MARRESEGLDSLLGAGVAFDGRARVEGSLRLDGGFTGDLRVDDTLVVGSTGRFEGTAVAREVVVAGVFDGTVVGLERVELQEGARLTGDVLARSFVIEPGVTFEGSCRMEFTDEDAARLEAAASGPDGSSRASTEGVVVRPLSEERR